MTDTEMTGAEMTDVVVFGSRGSDLALAQSCAVASELAANTGVATRIEVISTRGDRELSKPLPEIGGKGLFTTELEIALRERTIDVAVHSLKDLPVEDPEGLVVGAIPPRASAHDVLVCRRESVVADRKLVPLRDGARVGTSSLRRAGALRLLRPDLELADIRGNVPTRVARVASGDYDAVVLAAAGLERLSFELDPELVSVRLPVDLSPPAPGQGALGVQCRMDDDHVRELLRCLHDELTAECVLAERQILGRLGGGCSMPLGAVANARRGGEYRLHCGLFARGVQRGGLFRTATGTDLDVLAEQLAVELGPFVEPVDVPVVLARPGGDPGTLGEALAIACPQLRVVASSRIESVLFDVDALHAAAAGVLAFTSARAVHEFFAALRERDVAVQDAARGAFAVGPATAAALGEHGLEADVPAGGSAAGGARLARHILDSGVDAAERIVFPCAVDRHGGFEATLGQAGRDVRPLPLYRSVPVRDADYGSLAGSVVVLTSPSGVAPFGVADRVASTRCVAIGDTTAEACAQAGITVDAVAAEPEPVAILAAIRAAASSIPEETAGDGDHLT